MTADERQLAEINTKQFFNKEFPVVDPITNQLTKVNGMWTECRPSDSNKNGMVTCCGMIPDVKNGFKETTRYCGYRKELVGCSGQDTVNVS